MIQNVLLHEAQTLSTSLNKRQSLNELRVICKIAGEQELTCHLYGPIMIIRSGHERVKQLY
jgi:hypothetical protein